MYDTIIVGAGASGMVCAITVAKANKKVLLIEKANKVGKKILASGNGKCNITNLNISDNRYHSSNPSFITQTLRGYDYSYIKKFFKSIGLEFVTGEKEGRVFPMSLQASSVSDILEYQCHALGVDILLDTSVTQISKTKRGLFNITHTNGNEISKSVVISAGHISAPHIGGVSDGQDIASSLGHSIVDGFASLVQLTSPARGIKSISGIKIHSTVHIKGEKQIIKGDVLFTSYGVSGLSILDISRSVINKLKSQKIVTLMIDLIPSVSYVELVAMIESLSQPTKPMQITLQGLINKKLAKYILKNIKSPNPKNIANSIKSFEIIVDGSRGYKGAEVATGGVDTTEISPHTMMSKLHKNLYFTGEVIDIDGDRGGFNLHFAWTSGIRAGKSLIS